MIVDIIGGCKPANDLSLDTFSLSKFTCFCTCEKGLFLIWKFRKRRKIIHLVVPLEPLMGSMVLLS
jgi:hypothetical protein